MPNLSRRTVRWDDQTTAVPNPSEYISNAEHFSQEVYLSKAEKLPLTSTPISNGHPSMLNGNSTFLII